MTEKLCVGFCVWVYLYFTTYRGVKYQCKNKGDKNVLLCGGFTFYTFE